jgi:tRNA(Glu) U13 pseudouridine synthase TruD
MQYFLGSVITLIVVAVCFKLFKVKQIEKEKQPLLYSQSYVYNLFAPIMPTNNYLNNLKPLNSQAKKYYDKAYMRIIFTSDKAYWIKENALYVADYVDGEILEESTKTVDTMGMDKVELEKMSFIVDKLTEGLSNDSGNSGKS